VGWGAAAPAGGGTEDIKLKYIATVRDPTSTLLSMYQHRVDRGRFGADVPGLLEYAHSPAWLQQHMPGCMPSIWDYYDTFYKCR
jgi:hypothetical protein